jgi:hypothetical protein
MTRFMQRAPAESFGDLCFDDGDGLTFDARPAPAQIQIVAQGPAQPVQIAQRRRPRSGQDVLILIDRMIVVFKDPGRQDLERLPDLHRLANALYDLSGALHLKVMGRSAFLFCTLTDRMRVARRWDHASVAVFIEAFRRLHLADDDSPLAGKILEGLRRVADRADPMR